jgi:hypothetical protein
MEEFFGICRSHLSAAIYSMPAALYEVAIQYFLDVTTIWHDRMPLYAASVYDKCGLVDNVWGFIDGTLCPCCRPKNASAADVQWSQAHSIDACSSDESLPLVRDMIRNTDVDGV